MRRNMQEILASQSKMLERRGTKGASVSADKLGLIYTQHLRQVTNWLAEQNAFDVMFVEYSDVVADARTAANKICKFLKLHLNIDAMVSAVDPTLYRQKIE